jgi:hypothetical protein
MDNKRFMALLAILLALLLTIVILAQVTGAKAETAWAAFVTLENRNGVLNVRTAPVDGDVICYLLDGWDIAVLDTLDNWALVCHDRDFAHPLGWVCADYIHIYGGVIEYGMEGMQ